MDEPKDKTAGQAADTKKKFSFSKKNIKEKVNGTRINFNGMVDKIQLNGVSLLLTVISAIIFMSLICLVVFFAVVKGGEEVMVPNVRGKQLTTALLEMQTKELYPKIQLRYSDTPGDDGTILDQNPDGGSIVKAGRRISLVVSRGVIINHVEDYVGMNLDDVRIKLQTLFAGTAAPLIVLAEPSYKPDAAAAGTILEQDPPAGTNITRPVTVNLVVSRGPQYEKTKVPDLIGKSVNDMLMMIGRSKVVFDFTAHKASGDEKAGTIVSQQTFDTEYITNYTRMTADFAFPVQTAGDNVYGLFTDTLPEYPYPVPMTLDAIPPEGDSYTLASFSHPGGSLTIPYELPKGTVLILTVVNKEHKRITVN
ncbi:MAG: PASTA domain-containing protein [Treponema sp.]|jgi:beta-lactam-binding protein with PASTA domain|nr:PASTA domain-containing protein [Treponema sp.]